jgi:S-adenosylmethionine synthetase
VANRYLFTSESVTEGHPDKIADQISDAILDEILREDPTGRVACETLITTGLVVVAGEISTNTYVDISSVVRRTILGIGYDRAKYGYDGTTCGVAVAIDEQSPDIAQGVDHAFEERAGDTDPLDMQGAGDQGMMVGFACNETPELMPVPIALAHRLSRRLAEVRRSGAVPYLRPDGKTQVTVEYEGRKPVRLDTVVVSTQHGPDVDLETLLAPDIREHVIDAVLPDDLASEGMRVFVNPTGRFELGGAEGGDRGDDAQEVAGVGGEVGGVADDPGVDAAAAAEGDLDPGAEVDLGGQGLGHAVGEGPVQVEQRDVDQHLDACGAHVQVQPGCPPPVAVVTGSGRPWPAPGPARSTPR